MVIEFFLTDLRPILLSTIHRWLMILPAVTMEELRALLVADLDRRFQFHGSDELGPKERLGRGRRCAHDQAAEGIS